jgi:hypothetical protein
MIAPKHIEGATCWECPCRECTELDWLASIVDGSTISLTEFRKRQWPEVYT